MENKITDFKEAWDFLEYHPVHMHVYDSYLSTSRFKSDCLEISVVKVNPLTETVEDDTSLNTATRIWLECGPYGGYNKPSYHDWELDCGAETFEEAIIILSNEVLKKYGDYRDNELKYVYHRDMWINKKCLDCTYCSDGNCTDNEDLYMIKCRYDEYWETEEGKKELNEYTGS